MPGDWGPKRYDLSRELLLTDSAPVGATPVTDHPGQPIGKMTNLNQDLTL